MKSTIHWAGHMNVIEADVSLIKLLGRRYLRHFKYSSYCYHTTFMSGSVITLKRKIHEAHILVFISFFMPIISWDLLWHGTVCQSIDTAIF